MIFFNSQAVVDEFLNVVDNKFEVDAKVEVQSKFSIINYQPPENEFFEELIDQRSWITDIYTCKYFNEFVKAALKKDIFKRIIVNALTDSS